MTTNVISEMGHKWLPLTWESFFTPQRAADMWFGDELPPTLQDQVRSPFVLQSKWAIQQAMRRTLEEGARRNAVLAEQRRQKTMRSRVGKRTKAKRH